MDFAQYATSTITPAGNSKRVMYNSGSTKDIIEVILYADKHCQEYTTEFAEIFDGDTYEMCIDVYDFVQTNIKYKEDPEGKQWIKSPSQLWSDRVGDCKSFSIFIGSVLKNLGIPFVYRFVSFTAKGDVTHVYVVAFDEDGNEIILDAVPPMHFDQEHPEIKKRTDKKPCKPEPATENIRVGKISGTNNTTSILLLVLFGFLILRRQ